MKGYLIISESYFSQFPLSMLTITSSKNLKKNGVPVHSELNFEHVSFFQFPFTTKAIVSFLRNYLKFIEKLQVYGLICLYAVKTQCNCMAFSPSSSVPLLHNSLAKGNAKYEIPQIQGSIVNDFPLEDIFQIICWSDLISMNLLKLFSKLCSALLSMFLCSSSVALKFLPSSRNLFHPYSPSMIV